MKRLSRILCLLLTFVMVFCLIGGVPVWATEDDPTVTVSVTEPPLESETEDTALSETEPLLEVLPTLAEELTTEDVGLFSTRATYQDGKYRQRAVIWNTVGEKVKYTYNGKNNSYNTLLMHTLWYDGDWRAAYCIEPGKTLYVNSDYDEVENTGVDPWGKLDYNKQRGVGLALLYGYPNGIDSPDLKTQVAYQLATYLIVHEIILGWREDVHPFTRTNDAYFDVFGGGTPEKIEKLEITSEYHSSIHTKHLNNEDVWFAYNHISNSLATHDLVPSFAASHKNMAPVYTLNANGDGTYSITLQDTNNILSAYDFTNTADLTFTKSADGKSLTITTTGSELPETVSAPTRIVPSLEKSAYLIWNASNGSQELCTLKGAQNDPVPAYFKLKLPTGNVEIQKETSDGSCLSGWQFNIYADAECTQLVSGSHTTNGEGYISVTGLNAGTYWIKEIGHVSEEVNSMYTCEENPKQVAVAAGETATVTFFNRLIPKGKLEVRKVTDSGTDLIGWMFSLYADEACQTLVAGPRATNPNGVTTFTDLMPGTYWLKEVGNNTPDVNTMYSCVTPNPQQVTVISDQTVVVSVRNEMNTGAITIHKQDPYHNALAGAHFLLEWSYSGMSWKPVTYSETPGLGRCSSPGLTNGILITDSSGCVSFEGLAVGVHYRITEVKAPNGFQLLGDYAYEGTLTTKGEVVTLEVINTPVFTLPHTGSRSMIGMSAGLALCLITCIGAVIYLKKKE